MPPLYLSRLKGRHRPIEMCWCQFRTPLLGCWLGSTHPTKQPACSKVGSLPHPPLLPLAYIWFNGHTDTWQVNPSTHQPNSYTNIRSTEEQKCTAGDKWKGLKSALMALLVWQQLQLKTINMSLGLDKILRDRWKQTSSERRKWWVRLRCPLCSTDFLWLSASRETVTGLCMPTKNLKTKKCNPTVCILEVYVEKHAAIG